MNSHIIRIPIGTLKTALSTDHLDTLTLVRPSQFIRWAPLPPASPPSVSFFLFPCQLFLHPNRSKLVI
jgi:hypothetical protein